MIIIFWILVYFLEGLFRRVRFNKPKISIKTNTTLVIDDALICTFIGNNCTEAVC